MGVLTDPIRRAVAEYPSKADLGRRALVDVPALYRFAKGKAGLSVPALERLCGVLGLELRARGVERVAEVPAIVPTPTIPHQPREDPRKARKLGQKPR